MYYENFDLLCKKNNVKPSDVSKSTQISTATLSSWKKVLIPQSKINYRKLQIILKYQWII